MITGLNTFDPPQYKKYSTTPYVVGETIDKKPIYEKVIETTVQSTNQKIDDLTGKTLLFVNGICYYNNSNEYVYIPWLMASDNFIYVRQRNTNGTDLAITYTGSHFTGNKIIVIYKYINN